MYANRLVAPRYAYTDYTKLSYYALGLNMFGQWKGMFFFYFILWFAN